jgi:hypothetical protein
MTLLLHGYAFHEGVGRWRPWVGWATRWRGGPGRRHGGCRLGGPGEGIDPRGDGLAAVKMKEKESGLPEDLGQKQEVSRKRI